MALSAVVLPAVTTTNHAGLSIAHLGGGLLHTVLHMIPWAILEYAGGGLVVLAAFVVFRSFRYLRRGPVRYR